MAYGIVDKYDIVTEVLGSRESITGYLEHMNMQQGEFAKLSDRLYSSFNQYHESKRKSEIDEVLAMLKAKGIDPEELIGESKPRTQRSSNAARPDGVRAVIENKFYRYLDEEGKECVIYRKPLGKPSKAMAKWFNEQKEKYPEFGWASIEITKEEAIGIVGEDEVETMIWRTEEAQ
ncbi:hypothetical protein [Aeromonas salmonicida]|uniref:hypothetical protein n=1 Tax=Aeromonas salmonicida TaxID=645 RepID=UPI003D31A06E